MSFLYPQFLFGLFAVAVPIFIHLFNLRRHKTIYFSDISALKNVRKKTQSTSQLRKILTLLARILFITFLVFAFAQPFFTSNQADVRESDRFFSVYVDNSLSMGISSPEGTALQRAVQKGYNVVEEAKPTDEIQFLTNRFSARDELSLSQTDVIPLLDKLKTVPVSRTFSEVRERQNTVVSLGSDQRKTNFIISDFQHSFWNPQNLKNADTSAERTFLIPVKSAGSNNLAVDSLWFTSPVRKKGQKDSVNVRLINTADEENVETNAELFINDELQSVISVKLPPGKTDTVLYFNINRTGEHHGEVRIKDRGAGFDNQLYFRFHVPEMYRVAEIGSEKSSTSAVQKVFSSEDYFGYQFIGDRSGNFTSSDDYSLVVVNEAHRVKPSVINELSAYVKAGGSVMILPSEENRDEINNLLMKLNAGKLAEPDTGSSEVADVEFAHPLFTGVFQSRPKKALWPGYDKIFPYNSGAAPYQSVMRSKDGRTVLSQLTAGEGAVYLWSINLESSNLASNSIWLPVLYRSVFLSRSTGDQYRIIGRNSVLEIPDAEGTDRSGIEIYSPESELRFKPEVIPAGRTIRLNVHEQIQQPGIYRIEDANGKLLRYAAFNYSKEESDFHFSDPEQLRSDIEQLGLTRTKVWDGDTDAVRAELQNLEGQNTLWKWCVLAALLFLGLEVLLIRFLK